MHKICLCKQMCDGSHLGNAAEGLQQQPAASGYWCVSLPSLECGDETSGLFEVQSALLVQVFIK